MADDDLILRASLRDDLSRPLENVRGELAQTRREVDRLDRSSDQTSRSLTRMSHGGSRAAKVLKYGIAAGAAAAVAGLAALGAALAFVGVQAVRLAMDAGETESKFRTVFAGMGDHADRWVKQTHRAYGIATADLQNATSTFGVFAKAAGIATAEVPEFSTSLAQAGLDLASFYNVEPGDSFDALRAGLAGETEPLRRFGIFLSEATLKAKAASMGLTGELTEAQKVMVRHRFILDNLGDANGDLERTSDSLSNRWRALKGRATELLTVAGTALLPILGRLAGVLDDRLTSATENAADKVGDLVDTGLDRLADAARWAAPIVGDLAGAAGNLWRLITGLATDLRPVGVLLAGIFGVSLAVGAAVLERVTDLLADHRDKVLAVAAAYLAMRAGAISVAAWSAISGAITTAGASLAYVRTMLVQIAATRGVSTLSATFGALAATMTSTVSSSAAAGGILAGIAVGVTVAMSSMQRSTEHGKAAADEFLATLDGLSGTNLGGITSDLGDLQAEMDRLAEQADPGFWQETWQDLNPFVKNTASEAEAASDRLADAADEANDLALKLARTRLAVGNLTDAGLDRWVDRLDLDPATMSVDDMSAAIRDARTAAEAGTPRTDALGASFEVLADETATSTDRLKAWKDAVDTILGAPLDLADATVTAEARLDALTESFTANGLAGITAAGGLDATTEAGRANIEAATSAARSWIDLANAYGEQQGPEAAAFVLASIRNRLIDAGVEAGNSRSDMERYLEVIGLTPDAVTTAVNVTGVEEGESALAMLARDRQARIAVQLNIGTRYADQAAAYIANQVDVTYGQGGDTPRPHRGGRGLMRGNLAGTLARHAALEAATPGRRHITSALRFHHLGSPNSDHAAGRALDLTGSNLPTYKRNVEAAGGFAEFHGSGPNRHLHAAIGDTSRPRSGTGDGGAPATIVIAAGAITVERPASTVDLERGIADGVARYMRERAERSPRR